MGADGQRHGGWFVLEGAEGPALALPVELIGRLEPVSSWVPVPGAPAGVVALAEVRGRPTTLLDPALWTGTPSPAESAPGQALLLASPRDHLALARWPETRTLPWEPWRELPDGTTVLDGGTLERTLAEMTRSGGPA